MVRSSVKLFEASSDAIASHIPGGKVKSALPAGLRGDAIFSPCGRYRPRLRRWIGEAFPSRYWCLIGMNPSTAEAEYNDPTVTREWGYTARERYSGLSKCNIGDYRATAPADLLLPGVVPSSEMNLPVIIDECRNADRVVVCFGKVNKALRGDAVKTIVALKEARVPLWCFGTNGDGSPKHPLYLAKDRELVRFDGNSFLNKLRVPHT